MNHSTLHGYPTSSHQTRPAPVLAVQHQYTPGLSLTPAAAAAAAASHPAAMLYTPHDSTLLPDIRQSMAAAQQIQGPAVAADGAMPSDIRSQTAHSTPPSAAAAAAACRGEGEGAEQVHCATSGDHHQQADSAPLSAGSRRTSRAGSKAPPKAPVAAATGTNKRAAGNKRGRAVVLAAEPAGMIPEEKEDAAGDQQGEGAAKKPAGG